MQVSKFLTLSPWVLLFLAFTALPFPLTALDERNQNAVSQTSPLRSRSDMFAANSGHQKAHLPDISLHKRAGRPIGSGLILQAIRIATYIGARSILETLYFKILAQATNQPAGATLSYFEARYGNVALILDSGDSGHRFTWDLVRTFADMMLNRVLNGEQNFYIADLVADVPCGRDGQQSILLLMGTSETRQDIVNQPWEATLRQWLESHGL